LPCLVDPDGVWPAPIARNFGVMAVGVTDVVAKVVAGKVGINLYRKSRFGRQLPHVAVFRLADRFFYAVGIVAYGPDFAFNHRINHFNHIGMFGHKQAFAVAFGLTDKFKHAIATWIRIRMTFKLYGRIRLRTCMGQTGFAMKRGATTRYNVRFARAPSPCRARKRPQNQ